MHGHPQGAFAHAQSIRGLSVEARLGLGRDLAVQLVEEFRFAHLGVLASERVASCRILRHREDPMHDYRFRTETQFS